MWCIASNATLKQPSLQDLQVAVYNVLGMGTELGNCALSAGIKAVRQYVCISDAANKDGGALFTINGDYEKTRDVRNGRAVYRKVDDDKQALWMSADGTWYMGPVGAGKKEIGGTFGHMAAITTGHEASPELVSSGWKVEPTAFGTGNDDTWVAQAGILMVAVRGRGRG